MTEKNNIDQVICDFVARGVSLRWIHTLDQYYAINRLLNLLAKEHYLTTCKPTIPLPTLLDSMDKMVAYALEQGVIENSLREREELEAQIMDVITPAPSVVNQDFWENYREAPMRATDEFYELSRDNDYIKTRQIEKNEHFLYDSKYGTLSLTVNLSKPEKTAKDIAEAQKATGDYPICQLCAENEGYRGRIGISGRSNHRVVRLPIKGESWGFQYSPYSYYNEHCIIFTKKHIPMNVTRATIENLMEIVTTLPHYFIGSNAGLPIVGGSLLAHEHYQGGRHHFPMEDAEVVESWQWQSNPDVIAEKLYWPLSVIRLRSMNAEDLVDAGTEIMDAWEGYTNESLSIFAETETGKHNAVTLLARRKGEAYELDVVLRNNGTSDAYPDGIFHPHKDVQHIKQENIGLIEVLGLAILPPRLKAELKEVRKSLLGEEANVAEYHQAWAEEIKQQNEITTENVEKVVQDAVGEKFQRVLEDAGVFKHTEKDQQAFSDFLVAFQPETVAQGKLTTEHLQ